MLQIRKVLFPTDFSSAAALALPQALGLARRFGAELHAFHAVVLGGEHATDPEEALAAALAGEPLPPLPPIVRACERRLHAAPAILDYAREHAIDLIVLGTHGRRGPRRWLLGSVAEEVVRLAGCPVWTVPAREGGETPTIARILAPVDFSGHSRQGLRVARELAAVYGAAVDVAHVVEARPAPTFYGNVAADPIVRLMGQLKESAAGELAALWAEASGPEVAHELLVGEGRAAMEVVRLAEERPADLVVLATHGLSGIERLLMGSTAEAVVRAAPCAVLTVKSFGRSLLAP